MEAYGGYDSAGSLGKSEWRHLLSGLGLLGTPGGRRVQEDVQFLKTFPSQSILGKAQAFAVQHLCC